MNLIFVGGKMIELEEIRLSDLSDFDDYQINHPEEEKTGRRAN